MKIKENCSVVAFLQDVRSCSGEVLFSTPEGDRLNLKSLLSQYIFVSVLENPALLANGWVECSCPEDYALLSEYLETV